MPDPAIFDDGDDWTMLRTLKLAAAFGAMLAAFAAPAALAASEQQNLVEKARITLDDLRRDREFGNARDLMRRAKGVMIIPSLIKGGFFVGGEGGDALLLGRGTDGSWSDPCFYTLASASVGLQIGLEEAEVVLIVLSDRAFNAFMNDEFKVGAQAGLAIVTLGSTAEAATTSHFNADIVVWSSATGLYGGLTLNGSLIKPHTSYNEAYYGQAENPSDILLQRRAPHVPTSDSLTQALAGLS
jgi:lipid-binding SYLF domain-containing protein